MKDENKMESANEANNYFSFGINMKQVAKSAIPKKREISLSRNDKSSISTIKKVIQEESFNETAKS